MFPGRDSGSPGRSRDTTVPESGVCSQEELVVVRVVVETLLHLRAEVEVWVVVEVLLYL